MSLWKLVIPEATTNLLIDTSFFQADPDTEWTFAGDGAEDWTRGTTYQMFGVSSAVANLGGGTWADLRQTVTTTATDYTLSAYVRRSAGGVPTASHTRAYFDDAVQDWDSLTAVGGGWYYCVYTAEATAAANEFGVRVLEASAAVDGVQLENKAYATTYCDGSLDGCEWNGAAHDSTSTRSAQSRAGGRVKDFTDDYTFYPTGWTGWGFAPQSLGVDEYALLPGGQLNSVKVHDREFAIVGIFTGSSLSNLHSLRNALTDELAHDRYPKTGKGWQPVMLEYQGATTYKRIRAHYSGGLDGGRRDGFNETVAIRFRADDPYWYEIGNSAAVLDSESATTTLYEAGARLKSTGLWDDLSLTAHPDGGAADVEVICIASNGLVYFGGDFTGFNSDVGSDYVVQFDPSDESWNQLVGASEVDGTVYDIKEGPDGTIYLCGEFNNVGDAAGDHIVSYSPSGDSWTSLGTPEAGAAAVTDCREMAFDSSGNLYVVGDFLNFADVAAADYIAKWSGSAWAAVGTPAVGAGIPLCIAIDSQDNIVVGGSFTNWAGDADADALAIWNGTAWADLGSGTQDGDVYCLAFTQDDILYLGGTFTDQGGETDCDKSCTWNGRQFLPLETGQSETVYDISIAPDGIVYLATDRTFGTVIAPLMAWNGESEQRVDVSYSAGNILSVETGNQDPVIPSNYDIYIGFNSGTANLAADTATVTNDGTAPQHPVFKVYRTGGTDANLTSLRNETTGKWLMFDYNLLDGETLTVDCRPDKQSITSDFFGPRPDAILANSDFGSFVLQPDTNQITCFVDVAGAPTVTAWLEWRDAYKGAD